MVDGLWLVSEGRDVASHLLPSTKLFRRDSNIIPSFRVPVIKGDSEYRLTILRKVLRAPSSSKNASSGLYLSRRQRWKSETNTRRNRTRYRLSSHSFCLQQCTLPNNTK